MLGSGASLGCSSNISSPRTSVDKRLESAAAVEEGDESMDGDEVVDELATALGMRTRVRLEMDGSVIRLDVR